VGAYTEGLFGAKHGWLPGDLNKGRVDLFFLLLGGELLPPHPDPDPDPDFNPDPKLRVSRQLLLQPASSAACIPCGEPVTAAWLVNNHADVVVETSFLLLGGELAFWG